MRRTTLAPVAALAAAAAIAAGTLATGSALAASNPVITDCVGHGALTRTYTDHRSSIRRSGALTAETREYTNCQDVINRALAAAVSGKNTGGTGGSGSEFVSAHAGDRDPGDPHPGRGHLRRAGDPAPPGQRRRGLSPGHRFYTEAMPSERQIRVGTVPIGGGAPVAVQTMTKTETADLKATMSQIRRVAEAGADIVRVAVPREKDVEALQARSCVESPIPVIADIHFNHTLALKALDAGAHCVRLNPGNIGGPEQGRARSPPAPPSSARRCESGSTRARCPRTFASSSTTTLSKRWSRAAVETVELMERLDFENFKVSMKSTSVPNTIAANRLLSERIPYPLHLGVTEAGTKWSGSLKSAVGLGTLLADGIGDTIRISLSTFHAEEEVKVGVGDPQGAASCASAVRC